MLAEKLEHLVDQSLDNWHIEWWHAIYRKTPYGEKRLFGYCRYASSVEFLGKNKKTSNRPPFNCEPEPKLTSKPVLVLVDKSEQSVFNFKTGKLIVRGQDFIKADARAKIIEDLKKKALAKLTEAEKRALGLKKA